nr:NAD(P)H-binding protein [Streptomyces ficellus]
MSYQASVKKIAVLGATGMVGRRVVTEARARGHQVLALSRTPQDGEPGITPIAVDAADEQAVREALTTHAPEHVVVALRTEPVDEDFLVDATRTVLRIAGELGMHVLVVGGAGVLRSPGRPGLLVADNPAYVPDHVRPVAAAGVAQWQACQNQGGDRWVYLSPPALLEPGERTGRYRRGTDTLLTDDEGRSRISVEDLAVAVIDELQTPCADRLVTVAADEKGDSRSVAAVVPATTGQSAG